MAQKFIGLDDAAEQLGVPKDRLNELREAGKLRAYRDGASWKFRSEEIDGLAANGLPDLGAESAIGSFGAGLGQEPSEESLESDLELGSMEDLGDLDIAAEVGESIDLADAPEISDPDLGSIDEPTVAAEEQGDELEAAPVEPDSSDTEDDDLVLDVEGSGDDAESILLSEAELGETSPRPPSTIIGKSELALDEDDDLELAPSESDVAAVSDVRLADPSDDVFSTDPAGSEVIPGAAAPSGKFEDLEELEIDLEAESSRILEAKDVAAAQAAQQAQQAAGDSDLSLAPSESDVGLAGLSGLGGDEGASSGDASLTGISSLDIDTEAGSGSLTGLSSIELADDEDDDFVLGDSGSDITLAGGDSGINLIPSDSGIALDDASLGGSALGSSIDLGEIDPIGSGLQAESPSGDLAPAEDFLLTPIAEDQEDDEEDSSQIIALDAVEEDDASEDVLLGAGVMGLEAAEQTGFATTPTAPAAADEAAFSTWNVVGLGSCLTLMAVCGVMMVDVVRNIWSWQESYSTSSAVIDGLLGIFGK